MLPEDQPYALKCKAERCRRQDMLRYSHMAPLTEFVEKICKEPRHHNKEIPHFDPRDGGVNAKVHFLLEAAGPKAIETGFISRNNPDPTAKNFCELNLKAELPRTDTVIWNIVPWYVWSGGKIRAVNNADITEALPYLEELLSKLPELKVIVLVGLIAQEGFAKMRQPEGIEILRVWHTSNQAIGGKSDERLERRSMVLSELEKATSMIANYR